MFSRPRMMIYGGQMMFQAGEGKNISFSVDKKSGSTITFGDLDIQTLPTMGTVQEFKQKMRIYESRQNASQLIIASLLQSQGQILGTIRTAQSQVKFY